MYCSMVPVLNSMISFGTVQIDESVLVLLLPDEKVFSRI
jgi:hypothetical protein